LLGTFVEIAVAGAAGPAMHASIEAAFVAIEKVESLMSFHAAASDVSRLNNAASMGSIRVHSWTFQILRTAIDLHHQSAGTFDIAVAPILQGMGLLPAQPECPASAARDQATTAAIELLPGQRVRFRHPNTRIDLGGIAKGFAVDRAIDVLREHGIPAGLVNAGGDLAVFGEEPLPVHIRDPRDPSHLLGHLGLCNEALASSASRSDRLLTTATAAAVIDPHTRKPARGVLGTSVRAASCMLADALTKVAMLAGPSATRLLDRYRAGALLVFADGRVHMTADLARAVGLAA
jgi:thiamine biosynthesis lipoprotein